ncbi:TrbC family F-type conjugative pilus assembly protein [Vibrio mediterranei]|uniref:TrbC family F-type conjugative pilus assembly protein n=1 Tax=Vibrio mediterranei TaxID=689 RepID=UPI0015566927|nr:TrbC family F-type conjugative pilus assembly protein [Vibrio mediterranei]
MSKSLAAHIRFSKLSVLVAAFISSSVFASNSPLTSDDMAIIEQGRELAEKARQLEELPDWAKNSNLDQAQVEARQFFQQLQESDPTLKAMAERQAEKSVYTGHSTLIFASYSLGKEGLKDVLDTASGEDDVVVVFRGIPDGMSIGDGIKAVQKLAEQMDPVPNVVINSVLFQKHNVTSVPTIVVLEEETELGRDPKELAKVTGLSTLEWIRKEEDAGESGDFGVRGPAVEIAEQDFIERAKAQLAGIDWAEKKDQAVKRFWHNQQFNERPRAPRYRERLLDPSIYLSKDISTAEGVVFARKGEVINPLCAHGEECKPGTRQFTQAVIIFDPLDKKQMQLLAELVPKVQQERGVQRITYIATQFERDSGWDSYKHVTDTVDAPVYLLTPDVVNRFQVEYTPTVITAQGNNFLVREFDVKEAVE